MGNWNCMEMFIEHSEDKITGFFPENPVNKILEFSGLYVKTYKAL